MNISQIAQNVTKIFINNYTIAQIKSVNNRFNCYITYNYISLPKLNRDNQNHIKRAKN